VATACRQSGTRETGRCKDGVVADLPRLKEWRFRRWISEHAFDKLRVIDCTFAEFTEALESAEIIEETTVEPGAVKELLLVVDWVRPLHVVVVVDEIHEEERVITVYEPDDDLWSSDYRVRR